MTQYRILLIENGSVYKYATTNIRPIIPFNWIIKKFSSNFYYKLATKLIII